MIGTSYTIKKMVSQEMTAKAVGSGTLEVLATPALAALLESAACSLLQQHLPLEETSVGIQLDVAHLAPTPVGMEVTVEAVLTERDDKVVSFVLEASDEKGMICRGTHTRAVVNVERFMEKALKKQA